MANKNPTPRTGKPNKATTDVREAIAAFASANVGRMQEWVLAVAQGTETRAADPGKALDLYLRAIEYHVPKLARSEVTGKDGGAIALTVAKSDADLL